MRAACPLFRAREDYRGAHYILCARRLRFDSRDARDAHYRLCCCGRGACEMRTQIEGSRQYERTDGTEGTL